MAKQPVTKAAGSEVKSTALTQAPATAKGALIPAESFALISDADALEAMTFNLAGEKLSEFDLDRVRVPAAGGTVFQVPGLEGIANVEKIRGIIISVSARRAYWEDPNPTGAPPDCSSTDGFVGVGSPGGDCSLCPFNEFGSAVKQDGTEGRGKRCREMRSILMIRETDRLPIALIAPPGTLKNIRQYLMRLPVAMYMAVTEVSLIGDKNGDGIKYSKMEFKYIGHISKQDGALLKGFVTVVKQAIVSKAPMQSDFTSHDGDDPANVVEGSIAGAAGDGGDAS